MLDLFRLKNEPAGEAVTAYHSGSDRADVMWLFPCWQPALLEQVDQETDAGRVNTHKAGLERDGKKAPLKNSNPYKQASTENDLSAKPVCAYVEQTRTPLGDDNGQTEKMWMMWWGRCRQPVLPKQVNQVA